MELESRGPGLVRLSKIMSERGLSSRREADEYIKRGWVLVDGIVVNELGAKIRSDQDVQLSEEAQNNQNRLITIALHKPIGYVSGTPEDGYTAAIELLGLENQWVDERRPGFGYDRKRDRMARPLNPLRLKGIAPAGRLDIDSTGLIIFTQDGRVAKTLIGENSNIEKEYLVRVRGNLSSEDLKLLNFGLELDGKPLRPAKVSWLNEDQLRFVLLEGKKRQIRRMCEMVGLQIVGLKRVRIGRVVLGHLPEGQWRFLESHEGF